MSFTITSKLEQVPSYPWLCELAHHNQIQITGDERRGSFSSRDGGGEYAFDETGLHGSFSGRGVVGEFSFSPGLAVITILNKPFWLPEALLKQKIAAGLDALDKKLMWREPS